MANIDFSKLRTVAIKRQENIDKMREERDLRLKVFDTELYRNTIFWSLLSDEQRTERLAYRQSLLDITTQANFPDDIEWPEKPE